MKRKITEKIVESLASHPYLWSLVICLLLNPLFFASTEYIPKNALYLETLLIVIGTTCYLLYKFKYGKLRLGVFIILELLCILLSLFLANFYAHSLQKAMWVMIFGWIFSLTLYFNADFSKYRLQLNSLLIMGMGFFLKFYYVLGTSIYDRQYDVNRFGEVYGQPGLMGGHAFYIDYLANFWHLPDFDVRLIPQCYHPPLHHIFSAIWIYINEHIFLVGREPALESLQTVTLFYSLCIIVSAYKIFRYFELSKWSLYIPLIFVNFHPAIIRLATTINNDALMVVFVLISIIWAFRWYRDNTTKSLAMVVLFSSLGMMTKLSAIMVLPLIVCLFLAVLWRERSKRVCTQIILFFAIFLPMSFWFEVRNYVNWQIPIMYVQRMKESNPSFIGDRNFFTRISDFSLWQFRSVYLQNDEKLENCDINPLTIALKTSMFGEFIRDFTFSKKAVLPKIGAEYASVMLFWTNVLFSIISFFCAFFAFDGKYTCEKLSLLIFAGVMFVAIYWQIYDQPFVCSADFRYIAPMAVISPLFVGVYLNNLQAHSHKHFFINAMIFLTLLFSLCSTAVYWIVC